MRYLQFSPFILDSELPQLFIGSDSIDIEPKLHQLLLYFCRHPNVVISRDEIIDKVNQGVVVSDNAVNKMVANLRQLLGDNPRSPRFIKTIPKQGYSFIAEVEPLTELPQPKVDEVENPTQAKPYLLAASVVVILFMAFVLNQFTTEQQTAQSGQLVPLTRHNGVEFSPAISPNNQYFVYHRHDPANNVHQLWLQDLSQKQSPALLDDSYTGGTVAWASNAQMLVYTDYEEQTCQLKLLSKQQGEFKLQSTILCNALYVSGLQFDAQDQFLYFAARERNLEAMQVFKLNIADHSRQIINQPALSGHGNYSIDLSPDKRKLLILNADESYTTKLYLLDLKNNLLSEHGQFDWFLPHIVWHHDGKTLVHTSNTYSHELVQSDLQGNHLNTLVSTSNRVADNFARHPNKKDFYFTSFMMNNDIEMLNIDSGQRSRKFNSSVYDKLPVFGQNTNTWYFVSKSTGFSQLFSADEQTGNSQQLTFYENESELFGLDVSPDGSKILISGRNTVSVMTLENGEVEEINLDIGLIGAAHWLDDNDIAISAIADDTAQLYIYDLNKAKLQQAQSKWQAAFASPSGQRRFYIERSTLAVFEQVEQQFKEVGLTLPYIYGGSGLAVRATETSLVYSRNQDEKTELVAFDVKNSQHTSLGSWLFLAGFDARERHILASYEQSRIGDVMMTQFK